MPTIIKFIDSVIRNIKSTEKRQKFWCDGCPGFGLRVMPSGKKTFVYKYMNNRQGRWITIGKYSGWTIRKARGQYDLYYDQVHEYGRDPVQEIREAKGSGLTIDVMLGSVFGQGPASSSKYQARKRRPVKCGM